MDMSIWQMSFSGSMIILAVFVLRSLWGNRLPRKLFPVLWAVAALRLAIPVAAPSPFSAYTLLGQNSSTMQALEKAHVLTLLPVEDIKDGNGLPQSPGRAGEESGVAEPQDRMEISGTAQAGTDTAGLADGGIRGTVPGVTDPGLYKDVNPVSPWRVVWVVGALLGAFYFSFAYLRCRKEFAASLPVKNSVAEEWLKRHRIKRHMAIRSAGCVPAPLTYGLFRPVILVPQDMPWEDTQNLHYVLEHEFVHIRRLDSVTKLVMTGVLCMHWFNPLVWVMYVLFNRDLELSCDEAVIRKFGLETRAAYASALIHMEEKKSGLLPLYNGFGRNGVEERIRAVMRPGKTSAVAAVVAVCLVLAVTAAFATSAMEKNPRQFLTAIPGGDFTEEESRKLFALWIEDYEEMTVSQYQDRIGKMTDTPEYMELCSRLAETELVYEMPEGEEADALEEFLDYFHYVLMPLQGEPGVEREFSDCVTTDFPAPADNAILEYVVGLHILDKEELTVGEYARVHVDVKEALQEFLREKTVSELREGPEMVDALQAEFAKLESQEGSQSLEVFIDGIFQPLGDYGESEALLHEQIGEQSRRQWERTLAPYVSLGLSYEFEEEWEEDGLGITMYYQGKEVKGIFDEKAGVWITEHMGNTTYSADAVELVTVYENGKLAGLKEASEEEQKTWERMRNAAGAWREKGLAQADRTSGQEDEEREPRMFPPGTEEDYASLLALKTPDYQGMPLEKFNALLLDWCSEDQERMESIGEDAARNEYQVFLTEEEKAFVALTFSLSREENYRRITSQQTKTPRENPQVTGKRLYRQAADGIGWCSLEYSFSYDIADEKTVTVGERDRCIGAMLEEIQRWWQDKKVEELVGLGEAQVTEKIGRLAAECGNSRVNIQVRRDGIHFDCFGGFWKGSETQQYVAFDRVELLEYEESGWPYFAHSLVNHTEQTITGIQYCMLAYDKAGNPLKLYWNFMEFPNESSYEYLVELDGLSLWPHGSTERQGGWSLYDGPRMPEWPKVGDGGANQAVYGIYGIKQITFGDGTVWENADYEDWLNAYRGRQVPVKDLEAYYPYRVETGEI